MSACAHRSVVSFRLRELGLRHVALFPLPPVPLRTPHLPFGCPADSQVCHHGLRLPFLGYRFPYPLAGRLAIFQASPGGLSLKLTCCRRRVVVFCAVRCRHGSPFLKNSPLTCFKAAPCLRPSLSSSTVPLRVFGSVLSLCITRVTGVFLAAPPVGQGSRKPGPFFSCAFLHYGYLFIYLRVSCFGGDDFFHPVTALFVRSLSPFSTGNPPPFSGPRSLVGPNIGGGRTRLGPVCYPSILIMVKSFFPHPPPHTLSAWTCTTGKRQ